LIHQLLSDPTLTLLASLVLIPTLVFALTMGLVLALRVLLSPARSLEGRERLKYERYEAGNLPRPGEARGKVSMQYLGYLIMFLAVEPAVILLAVALAAPEGLTAPLAALYLFLIAVYAPLLYYGVKASSRVEEWFLE
jgi:NADH-quinone oxidoreductase subunit A